MRLVTDNGGTDRLTPLATLLAAGGASSSDPLGRRRACAPGPSIRTGAFLDSRSIVPW
jgi:hypothetical protein